MRVASFDVGIKNLAMCVARFGEDGGPITVEAWRILPVVGPKEKVPPMGELSARLFRALDDAVAGLEEAGQTLFFDHVLIENQPCQKNPTMKSVQMMLYSYFQLLKQWEGRVGTTHLVSASTKLAAPPPDLGPPTATDREGAPAAYALNKQRAVRIAAWAARACPCLAGALEAARKKDDLADSLLQAVAWHRRRFGGPWAIAHAVHCKCPGGGGDGGLPSGPSLQVRREGPSQNREGV